MNELMKDEVDTALDDMPVAAEATEEVYEPSIDKATIMKRYDTARVDRAKYERDWRVYIDKFDGKVLYAKKDWQSDVSVPEIHKAVKALVSHEMKEYWSRAFFQLEASNPANDAVAKRKQRLAEIRIMGYPHRMRIWEQTSTDKYLIGCGTVKQWYHGGWRFGNISPYNFYPEPGKETVDDCLYVFHEDTMSKDAARKMFDDGVWKTKYESTDSYEVSVEMMLEGAGVETHEQTKMKSGIDLTDSVNVLEYWENDVLCVVLNKKWLVRKSGNPLEIYDRFGEKRKPFLGLQCSVARGSYWGSPLAANTWNLCDKLDRHFNMALDTARLKINPPRKFGIGAGVLSDGVMDVSPGRITRVQRINEEQIEKFEGAVEANNVAMALLRNATSDSHAVNETVMGKESPSSNDTATGKSIVSEAASKRIELYTYTNEDFCMDFVAMWMDIEKQFMEGPVAVKMRDERRHFVLEALDQKGMAADVDIIVRPPRQMVNRQAYLQNEILKYNTLFNNGSIDKTTLARKLLEAFDERNVDEYILNEDEMVQKAVEAGQVEIRAKQELAASTPMASIPGQSAQPQQMTDQRVITQE